jgi:hypothetical protein
VRGEIHGGLGGAPVAGGPRPDGGARPDDVEVVADDVADRERDDRRAAREREPAALERRQPRRSELISAIGAPR